MRTAILFRQVQPVNFVFTHLSDIPWRFEEENVGNKKLLLQPCASVVLLQVTIRVCPSVNSEPEQEAYASRFLCMLPAVA